MAKKDETISKDWDAVAKKAEAEAELVLKDEEQQESEEQESKQEESISFESHDELETKLTEAEQKAHENWEKAVRAQAELENVRRRSRIDVENAHKYSIEKFAKEILPVIDSLESALESSVVDEKDEALLAVHQGVELTLKMLLDSLAKFSIEQVNPVGESFDPNLHEAMSMQPDPDTKPGTILIVIQKGYQLHERLIRPARVIVSK